MRILFGCEFYAPSIGGVQEVMRQLAERLVMRGHEVTVATTELPTRRFSELNGVAIREFRVSGNLARGMEGQVAGYRRFVASQPFDVIMVKAAQQWTFDALWPELPKIKAAKVFVPCGFSCLFEPAYAEYFQQIPGVLQQFDHLIFYASDYRDINFVKERGINRFSVIPNGASEVEFSVATDRSFKRRHDIGSNDLLFLTVGSLSRVKGHLDVAKAFLSAELDGHPATLILNGHEFSSVEWISTVRMLQNKYREYFRIVRDMYGRDSLLGALRYLVHGVLNKSGIRRGRYAKSGMTHGVTFKQELLTVMAEVGRQGRNKRIVLTDLPRPDLVQAYMQSDLFVFASHIEYSPLVLFESVAAGTPFLSVPVGNAEEIACWTGAGVICPASQDGKGHTDVNPEVLGKYWSRLAKDRGSLRRLGLAGREQWAERFTWQHITDRYEQVFRKVSTHE